MEPKEKIIYHYTTINGLMGILDKKCLWTTYFQFTNDRTELIFANKLILNYLNSKGIDKEKIYFLNKLLDSFYSKKIAYPFLFSFCDDHGDRLSQWRGYSNINDGYSIGFDVDELKKCSELEIKKYPNTIIQLNKILYCEKDIMPEDESNPFEKLLIVINKIDDSYEYFENNILNTLFQCMFSLKHKGYEEEKEYRLIVLYAKDDNSSSKKIEFRMSRNNSLPYIDTLNGVDSAIKEIIIGPSQDIEKKEAFINIYLQEKGLDIKIRRSFIPFIS